MFNSKTSMTIGFLLVWVLAATHHAAFDEKESDFVDYHVDGCRKSEILSAGSFLTDERSNDISILKIDQSKKLNTRSVWSTITEWVSKFGDLLIYVPKPFQSWSEKQKEIYLKMQHIDNSF